MSRVKLAIIFFASVSLGNAAAALQLGASEAVAVRSVCECSSCDVSINRCVYTEHYRCGFDQQGLCYSIPCLAAQQCL